MPVVSANDECDESDGIYEGLSRVSDIVKMISVRGVSYLR